MRLYLPSVQFELAVNCSGTTTGCNPHNSGAASGALQCRGIVLEVLL